MDEERDIDRIRPANESGLSDELQGEVFPRDLIGVAPTYIEVADNPEQAMVELFRQGGPDAAQTIVNTARGQYAYDAPNRPALKDKLAFDAAKVVVERVLGKPKEQQTDSWESSIARLLGDVEGKGAEGK